MTTMDFSAAYKGDMEALTKCLDDGAFIDSAQKDTYYTAVIWASRNGKLDAVQLLVERGANVHAKDSNGNSALHWAAEHGHVDVVRYLLELGNGSHVNDQNRQGYTPLHFAAACGKVDTVEALLENGANPRLQNNRGQTVVKMASNSGQTLVVDIINDWPSKQAREIRRLQKQFEDLEAEGLGLHQEITLGGEYSERAAQFVASVNELLLSDRVKKDCPIHAAVQYGYMEDIEAAVEQHIRDINKTDPKGRTATDFAALTGQLEIIDFLVEKGGSFRLHDRATMMAFARPRSIHVKAYLQYVRSEMSYAKIN